MIIRFLNTELEQSQKNYKQILIGKLWHSRDAYNFMVGQIGTKKKGQAWNFSEVTLHPEDRIFIKLNKYKAGLRDPEFLIYVENQPNGVKEDKLKTCFKALSKSDKLRM